MSVDPVVRHALKLLREFPDMVEESRRDARRGNSRIGGIMWMTLQNRTRHHCERAVVEALALLDEGKKPDDLPY